MTQKPLITRAGRGLLDMFKLLLRGASKLCVAFGSLYVWAISVEHTGTGSSVDDHDFYDGNSLIEKEEEARINGWKSW